MATSEDYGINDPNLLQLLSGINSPSGLAALLNSSDNMGGMFLPSMRRKQDEVTKNFLMQLNENNVGRALLHNKNLDITKLKNDQTHEANMMNHAPGLAKEGILSSARPYDALFRRPGVVASDTLNLESKDAYNKNQRAEAYDRLDTAGYRPDDGTQIDPNSPDMPGMKKGTPRSILEALARAQANNGKLDVQFDAAGNRIGMTGKFNLGGAIPNNINDVAPVGIPQEGLAVAPAAEQAMRQRQELKNAQFSRLQNGKGFIAKYKSGGKDIVVHIPADAQGRPLTNQAQVVDGAAANP